jgi:NAD-dependent DNA ligase
MAADKADNFSSDSLKKSLNELLGLARGLMADQLLSDSEILYMHDWLEDRYSVTSSFPGNVIHARIKEVLEDGIITEEERRYLVETLNTLIEGRLEDLTDEVDLTELWFDEPGIIDFHSTRFCLTGNFVYGPREVCQTAIESRGGQVLPAITNEPEILVVGGLGVDEWRTGRLGSKIEAALQMKKQGLPVKIIAEEAWVEQL